MQFKKLYFLIFLNFLFSCNFNKQNNSSRIKFHPTIDSLISSKTSVNKVVDSLLLDLKLAKTDTAKIDALNQLPENYTPINLNIAKLFATEAFRLADSINYDKGQVTALSKIALYYGVIGNSDSCFLLLRNVLNYANNKNDLKLKVYCFSVMANVNLISGNLDSCILYSSKALNNARIIKDEKFITYNYGIQAQFFLYSGKIDSCIIYTNKVIQLLEKQNKESQLVFYHRFLGDVYRQKEDYPKAIENLKQALLYGKRINDKRILGATYITLAAIYESLEEFDIAFEYYKGGLVYSSIIKDIQLEIVGYIGISNCYHQNQQYELAKAYLLKALNGAKSNGNYQYLASLYLTFGKRALEQGRVELAKMFADSSFVYVNIQGPTNYKIDYYELLGAIQFKKGDYEKSIDTLVKGMKQAIEFNNFSGQKKIGELLFNAYKLNSDYKEALFYYGVFKNAEDSLMNDISIKKFAASEYSLKEQELKLLQEKRETELEIINQKNIQRKNYWLYGTIATTILLIIFVIALYFYFKQRHLKTQKLQLIEEQKRLLIEQKFLRSQMNPHFIYNSLESIQTFVLNNEAILASEYLSRFARLMRLVLEHSREEYVSIEEELNALEIYLSLQQVVYENKFVYTILVDDSVNSEIMGIPPMLIQPFVENAIKHGIINKEDSKGKVAIKFKLENEFIIIEITDNGIGLTKSKSLKGNLENSHQSLSTIITRERLELLNKDKIQTISIDIKEDMDISGNITGTVVVFKLPIKLMY